MPIDDYVGDKPDGTPNVITTPGKYIKITVADFSDTAANTNPANQASTPLSTYLRIGAVEDVTKAGKAPAGTVVGLVTDMETPPNPLSPDPNAPFNPSYDAYAPFGAKNNFPSGSTPLPTPGSPIGTIPAGAPVPLTPSGPDPTGEDLASLVQGFADDTRNRGRPRLRPRTDPVTYTPGGQPLDQGATAQGPMNGYPWVTPVTDPKAPGVLDAGNVAAPQVPHMPAPDPENLRFTASSKPPFYPDDYRTLESSQLHTKGGWRDHTDGNRITTTRGDKIEVIRGNYKLVVLGRQDQTKPKYAGMDISGGQSTTSSSDLAADASTDFFPGSTAYSSLFEWRQCATEAGYSDTVAATVPQALQDAANFWTQVADDAVATLNATTLAAQQVADPDGILQQTIDAAEAMVLLAQDPKEAATATAAVSAAKKALLTAEQAVEPNLLQGTALTATAAQAPSGWKASDVTNAVSAASAQANNGTSSTVGWTDPTVTTAVTLLIANLAPTDFPTAKARWRAWQGIAGDDTDANQTTADAADATNAATAAAAAEAASVQASAAAASALAAAQADTAPGGDPSLVAIACNSAVAAANANPPDPVKNAQAATDLKNAIAASTDPAAVKAAVTAAVAAAKATKTATKAAQAAADAAAAAKKDVSVLGQVVANALSSWTSTIQGQKGAASVLAAAQLQANMAQEPAGSLKALTQTDAAAYALSQAAYYQGMVEAYRYQAGYFTSPLETLQLWEDDDAPKGQDPEFRQFSTTKKGSGPRVQVKYQRDQNGLYTQDRVQEKNVPGDGVTFALPISMGVSINETWSHQIYNYTGIAYYPATQPQPWPPPPPKALMQPIGTAHLGGVGLPADAPDRDADALKKWSPVPRWVIYPVSKIVNKRYVVHQSSEVFAKRTVSITAGTRPADHDNPDPTDPRKTYAPDVTGVLLPGTKTPTTTYADTLGKPRRLPGQATYDRDLFADDMELPSKATLEAWILNPDPKKEVASIRDYHRVDQTWTETHIQHQASFVRAGTTLSDTKIDDDQYTNVVVGGGSTSNTTVGGTLHRILHTGNTTVDTHVDASQTTTVHAGDIYTHTVANSITTTSAVAGPINSLSAALATNTIKAAILDLQIAVLGVSASLQVAATAKMHVGPMDSVQIGPQVSKSVPANVEMDMVKALLHGATKTEISGVQVLPCVADRAGNIGVRPM